jgi:mono/diheme cytochrome c family protein
MREGRLTSRCVTAIAIPIALSAAACHRTTVPLPRPNAAAAGETTSLVARGAYIVRDAAACGQCHARDPEHDLDGPLTGGRYFRDWRLGTIRASNLTSDSATGLGTWTEAEIVRALRNGEARDGRLLAPVMPYAWLHRMSDQDAFAVARYLKTQPAVPHAVREHPNIWFKLGKLLFLGPEGGTSATAPPQRASAEYGAYLAKHVALCADCHTPRTGLRSTPDRRRLFAGDAHPPKEFPANPSNLTPDTATGIGRWSEDDFLRTIHTGVNPQGDSLTWFMPWREMRRMTDDDLRAIYRYLQTLPPIRNDIPRRSTARS